MAVVGEQLLQPETGWKRYDDIDPNIGYSVSPGWRAVGAQSASYGGTFHQTSKNGTGAYARFNFKGTKLRFISSTLSSFPTDTTISIDGTVYTFNVVGNERPQVLVFEIKSLFNGEHLVEIKQNSSSTILQETGIGLGLVIDAIDIDEDGELLPYNPDIEGPTDPVDPTKPSDPALLRVTMIDSSEREYKVTRKEAENFTAWMSRPVNTGTTTYALSKILTDSKEYLLFDKIISFEVK